MSTVLTDFSSRLKLALTGRHDVTFVYLNNFEVEQYWEDPEILKLPSLSIGSAADVVHRMEELGVFLAGDQDIVLLKSLPSPDFISAAQALGFGRSRYIAPVHNNPGLNITASLLQCSATMDKLRELAQTAESPVFLVPFGTSEREEELSHLTGIPLAVPSSMIFRQVNDKGYSRRLNKRLDIRQIPGVECASLEELASGFEQLKFVLEQGGRLVLKDSMGVSGKGITVIPDEARFQKCMSMLEKQAGKKGIRKINYVLEQWIDKICDLNYQILIDQSGGVEFLGVKESLVEQGVHQGHLMPSRLSEAQLGVIREAAIRIGEALYQDGYYGIAGMDAILDEDGTIWPNLEINARFNMSTYQLNIQQQYLPDGYYGLAKKYTLRLHRLLEYKELHAMLGEWMFRPENGEGLLINNFATVNAAFKSEGTIFSGRLYGIIIGSSPERLAVLDEAVEAALSSINEVR
ncbi:phosphoribosylglycinamide formyltransferase 2 [Paenibacillus silvae]|uniref:Phosphoribosylglycinamide formyltransferase 2 n=1 Tax=Paenibacillus silvae TaxID=1325358 RepID=A0ABQ1ZF51_9BACL|nr:ATP-grasp domain-containing protein [Paenibacillus silvae]GGH62950.1 phosphoribosylglycinamide formyltransferase 2 [Paenibacillus silvae]